MGPCHQLVIGMLIGIVITAIPTVVVVFPWLGDVERRIQSMERKGDGVKSEYVVTNGSWDAMWLCVIASLLVALMSAAVAGLTAYHCWQIERRLDERLDELERRVSDKLPVLEFRVEHLLEKHQAVESER